MTKKIFVVGRDSHYAQWIEDREIVDDISRADIVIFTGGEDVDPSLYGHEKHESTYSNLERDKREEAYFKQIKPNQLAVGICRGSQFLCVMNGGKLIQDCDNHAIITTHGIYDMGNDRMYEITSTHHQMQFPFNLSNRDYQILACAHPTRCSHYVIKEVGVVDIPYECEIVWYHKKGLPQCLAIQGHPEYMRKESPIIGRLNEYVDSLLANIK